MSHLLLLELGFFVKFVFIIVDFCVSILLPFAASVEESV